MPGEQRGLSSRTTREAVRDREIGDEPTNSRNGSEAAAGVACQSEGRTQVPLLHALRQGVPEGRALDGLATLPDQRRRGGHRRRDVRGHRSLRRDEVAGGTGGRTQNEDVPAGGGTSRVRSQAGREAAAAGHPDDPGPRGPNRGADRAGADLRGGPATGAVRLPSRPERPGGGPGGRGPAAG